MTNYGLYSKLILNSFLLLTITLLSLLYLKVISGHGDIINRKTVNCISMSLSGITENKKLTAFTKHYALLTLCFH